mmetsp:Transcript_1916/g.1827  ORF Transcript_1916/g.1827 Transcript_1916/m.1827 type:complete len:91 (+) Transcript_1916:518-790(+)
MKSHDEIKTMRKLIGQSFDVDPHSFEIALIQDESIQRVMPRYEQVSTLNIPSSFIFAIEIKPEAFVGKNDKFFNSQNMEPLPNGPDQWSY